MLCFSDCLEHISMLSVEMANTAIKCKWQQLIWLFPSLQSPFYYKPSYWGSRREHHLWTFVPLFAGEEACVRVCLSQWSQRGEMRRNPDPQGTSPLQSLQPAPLCASLQDPGSHWLQLPIPYELMPYQGGVERKMCFPGASLNHPQCFQNGSWACPCSFQLPWSLFSTMWGFLLFQPDSLSTDFHFISTATPAWNPESL